MGYTLKRVVHLGNRRLEKASRRLTRPLRMLPRTLIIGAQKAGTTSLYNYIVHHPQVLEPARKEVRYFHAHYGRGISWYRTQLPIRRSPTAQTLDASTGYLDNPLVPGRVSRDLPDVRIIALLREPVARAWSHYRHSVRLGVEPLPFSDALEAEERRLVPVLEGVQTNPGYYPRQLSYYSYRRRGRYAEHLERWFGFFDRERFLILVSDDLYERPAETMERVWKFLSLPHHDPGEYPCHNAGQAVHSYDDRDLAAMRRLRSYFAPHNEQLEELVGRKLKW